MKTIMLIALSIVFGCGAPGAAYAQEPPASASAAPKGCEWLAPFIDDASMAVVVVDVARVDATSVADLMKSGGEASNAAQDGERLGKAVLSWKETFVRAGGEQLAMVFSLKDPSGAPAYFVIKPRGGAELEVLRANVAAPEVEGGQNRFGTGRPATIDRGCVIVASESQRNGLGTPERGAAMARAFDLAGDAPVRIALFPADYAKRALLESMPRFAEALGGGETRAVLEGLLASGGAITLGAEPSLRMGLACASDADAARLTAWLNERAKSMPAGYAGVVRPVQEGSLVRVDASGGAVRSALVQLCSNAIMARRAADQMQVMVKIRNAIMGCWMYSQSHNDAFPDALDQLISEKHITPDVIKGAEGADLFVYTRPGPEAFKDAPSETIVVHEKFKEWPARGLAVGFVDGHVEIIADRARFEGLLARKPAHRAGEPGVGTK